MRFHRHAVLGLALCLPAGALADFQYQETTQITGGSMLSLMKMAGTFSHQARNAAEPIVSQVYVQGNRLARVNAQRIEIIDLDQQTITEVDLQKRTYTRMTFDELRQRMAQQVQLAKEKQAEQKGSAPAQTPNNVDMQFIVNVRNTGASKQVSGLNTSESILTMQMQGTGKTNGQKGALAITNDMWLTPAVPGYDELREFNKRLALKMGDIFHGSGMSSSFGTLQPGMAQGMASMAKEVSKLKGVPIQQVMRMGATANGEPLPAASEAPLPPASADTPSVGDIANQSAKTAIANQLSAFHFGGFGHNNTHIPAVDAATQTATSGMASRLTGFGFGHKKKSTPPPATADTQQSAAQAQAAGVLLESTTNLTGFSSGPVDPSKFSVPPGFQQVEPKPIQ